jgi:kynurenine formamidase
MRRRRPNGGAPGRSGERASAVALLAAGVLWTLGGCATAPDDDASVRWVDLSHAYDADTVYWPTEEGFVLEREAAGVTPGGYWYAANAFRSAEHGGTHVDAPVHFHEGGAGVDAIPLDRLIGEAVRIDVRGACARDRDHRIDRDDLAAWERAHGPVPSGAIVLLDTGFAHFWPDRVRYMGTDARGAAAVASLHFPGLHPDAARWLVETRDVAAVGIDTPSIDHGPSAGFETHRVLAAAGVPAFENLAALDALPPRGFEVFALPMKIRGGSGGPLRIVARVPGR